MNLKNQSMKLRINCGLLPVSRMREKSRSMCLPVNFTSLGGLKMQGGFFPEDKGRPIRATVTEFVYSPQATKER